MTKKVLGLAFAVTLAVLTFFGTAEAFDLHIVKSGENLSKIAVQHESVSWKEIWKANKSNIKNPNFIYPGQELVIPDQQDVFLYENPGADKYKGSLDEALELLGFPKDVSEMLKEKIAKKEHEWHSIAVGDELAMTFGRNKVRYKTVAAWKDESQLQAAKKYTVISDNTEYALLYPLVCGNWSRLGNIEILVQKKITPVHGVEQEPEVEVSEKTHYPELKEVSERKISEFNPEDMIEVFAGAGYYTNAYENIDADGYFVWALARFQPFKLSFENFDVKLGAFIKGGIGGGDSSGYDYHSKYYLIGPSIKAYGDTWDMNTDIGVGERWNKGGKGLYRSELEEDIFGVNADFSEYSRRLDGKLWFPKWTLDAQYLKPFNVDHKHWWKGKSLAPDPYDGERFELGFTQYLYDFWYDHKLFRLTPGIRFGGGHEWGPDKSFGRIDLPVQWATHNYSILKASIGYKEQFGGTGDQYIAALSLNVVGLFDAIRISSIKEAHKDELHIPINFE